ncbi:MAG: BMP family ABC transporter substrate-binding protein [Treponema sp.]|nr:BMP family ABC transporter substrate-binding protein [Treponema sp.]
MKNRREFFITLTVSLIIITGFVLHDVFFSSKTDYVEPVRIGFIYDGDESIPATNNFIRAQNALIEHFGNKIEVFTESNVAPDFVDDALEELVSKKCKIIFTTNYSHEEIAKEFAEKYPDIQFCQAFGDNAQAEPVLSNYHTFMAEIYQGRYVSGIVAGLKLKELIENGELSAKDAKIGYVASYPYPEVISGYTAFFLGVRSIVPNAVMTVSYTYSWSNFSLEKSNAQRLINEGCVIISQHTDTIGVAVACEEAASKKVFHIGYNQSMINFAPQTSLVSTRINWQPYFIGAVEAILKNTKIEKVVKGKKFGNDVWAGFDLLWVQVLELNTTIVAKGTEEKVEQAIKAFKKSAVPVFQGNYVGVNPFDEEDTYDLRKEFKENKTSSSPKFRYVLKDVITVEEDSLF